MAKQERKGESKKNEIVSTSELAGIVGKTPQWIRHLTREGVLTQVGRGKYVLGDAVQAYINHVQDSGDKQDKLSFKEVKTEHEMVKKEKAEIELRTLKGQLHEAKDVRAVLADMILTTKSQLQVIPDRVALQLENQDATTIEKVLMHEINESLNSLKEYSPQMFKRE